MRKVIGQPQVTQRSYCLELDVDYFLKVCDNDVRDLYGKRPTLQDRLKALGVVDRLTDYDERLGPYIFYSLELEQDTPEIHKNIRKAIQQYAR